MFGMVTDVFSAHFALGQHEGAGLMVAGPEGDGPTYFFVEGTSKEDVPITIEGMADELPGESRVPAARMLEVLLHVLEHKGEIGPGRWRTHRNLHERARTRAVLDTGVMRPLPRPSFATDAAVVIAVSRVVVVMVVVGCASPRVETRAEVPQENAAPSTLAASPFLRMCPADEAMTFVCGRPLRGSTCSATRPALTRVTQLPGAAVPARARLHERWTAAYPEAGACCYAACVLLDARDVPNATHNYRSLRCVLAPVGGCPDAVRFDEDWPGHVAAREDHVPAGWRPPDEEVCCYGSAPAAAIGPL